MGGYVPRRGSKTWRSAIELLSSMRFAIALFTIICIASVVGTVLTQYQPTVNYVDQFGPFWASVFFALDLNAVYSAWWFLLIMAFLVVSTSLCIARNTPKFLADVRNFKENVREQSLRAFHHKAEGDLAWETPQAVIGRVQAILQKRHWKAKVQERERPQGKGWMIAAKIGGANKIGYIAAHSAIVLICLGGLMDGNLFTRTMGWLAGRSVYSGSGLISEIGNQHRLPASNPTFRGNLLVPEGGQSNVAVLNESNGVLLQDLPFTVELKKFTVDYYSTGQPRLFASDIVIHDPKTGKSYPERVEVNHPVSFDGVTIYQSDFDDGGSHVTLTALPMHGSEKPYTVQGRIGGSSQVTDGKQKFTLEYSNLRVINVENLSAARKKDDGVKPRAGLARIIARSVGAADRDIQNRDLHNVGPSITYRLRDASGQAREYNNYMLPIKMGDGVPEFLLGVRDTEAEPFRYLRIPADDKNSMEGFIHLQEALHDKDMRAEAVRRYVAKAVGDARPELAQDLTTSAGRALDLFAGTEAVDGSKPGGLQAVSDFIETAVPKAERERAASVLLRILNGCLFELDTLSREQQGEAPLDQSSPRTHAFMTQAVLALSDASLYPSPMVFQLSHFKQIQASVFQVARAPGKTVVYFGALLLILGVFSMLYIRERRLWVWLTPAQGSGTHAMMALSSNRKTLDTDREFEELRHELFGAARDEEGKKP